MLLLGAAGPSPDARNDQNSFQPYNKHNTPGATIRGFAYSNPNARAAVSSAATPTIQESIKDELICTNTNLKHYQQHHCKYCHQYCYQICACPSDHDGQS
jgi:hypothetical protein